MIKELMAFYNKLVNGDLAVKPGQAERISEAAACGDFCWQGDLKFTIVDKIPKDYTQIEPTEADKQLVPGSTEGAKHCLNHLDVEYYVPKEWSRSDSYNKLDGPIVLFKSENVVSHNEHGNITIPAGMCIQFNYQKNFDIELQKEIRARD